MGILFGLLAMLLAGLALDVSSNDDGSAKSDSASNDDEGEIATETEMMRGDLTSDESEAGVEDLLSDPNEDGAELVDAAASATDEAEPVPGPGQTALFGEEALAALYGALEGAPVEGSDSQDPGAAPDDAPDTSDDPFSDPDVAAAENEEDHEDEAASAGQDRIHVGTEPGEADDAEDGPTLVDDFEAGADQLVLVYDDTVSPDPELAIETVDDPAGAYASIRLDDHEVARVSLTGPDASAPGLEDIALVAQSDLS